MPTSPIRRMYRGTSSNDAVIEGISASVAGVIAVPTVTPSAARETTSAGEKLNNGAPAIAIKRQADIGPSRNGSGKPKSKKSSAPNAATVSVIAMRPNVEVGKLIFSTLLSLFGASGVPVGTLGI